METEHDLHNLDDLGDNVDGQESITERLRRQRKAQAENKFHDLDLPGYNGELFCRYRLLGGDELDAVSKKVRQQTQDRSERMLAVTLDTLISACQEIWVRDEGKEKPLREVIDPPTELPITYGSAELVDFLQIGRDELGDPVTTRNIVLAVFGGNDLAVSAHGARLIQWMMQSGRDIDEMLGGF